MVETPGGLGIRISPKELVTMWIISPGAGDARISLGHD